MRNLNEVSVKNFLPALAVLAVTTWHGPCAAQAAYPQKPIRIISPFAAGGGNDAFLRTLAPKLTENLKQQIIVDTRAGANGIVGTELAARAAPDGYTLVLIPSNHTVNASLYAKLPYDSIKDFTPVSLAGSSPLVVAVHPSLPVKSLKALIAFAKAKPGELTYGSAGVGSSGHLAGVLLGLATGIDIVHVPYKAVATSTVDLLAGQVDTNFDTMPPVLEHIRSGKLRALAITTPKRSPELPELPTLAEAGVAGAEMATWYGLFVTGGTPQPVIDRLTAEVGRVLQMPDVQARLRGLGGEPGTLTREQFGALNRAEFERFGKLIRDAGIKLEQ